SVMSTTDLENCWNQIFNDHLIPLKDNNPDKPILFLEFGYVDAIGSPHMPSMREFETKFFEDSDLNGLDDGEETQANVYSAFFDVNENNSNLIEGAFLWGNQMSSNVDWANSFDKLRTFSIRNKIAEDTVRQYYAQYTPLPGIPELISPTDSLSESPTTLSLIWHSSVNSTSYRVQVASDSIFSNILIDKTHLDTTLAISDLQYNTPYFWQVKSFHQAVESDWSQIYSFTTVASTSVFEIPVNFKLDQNYPNPFNPKTVISMHYAVGSNTVINIYNTQGVLVDQLLKGFVEAGTHEVIWDASGFNSGIYFYRLQAGEFADTKKMILLK
ncbi:MAG: T9SS type A sorting domain-containing protein, partial [Candidatus Marinimicrobia bacterium]|nr:T9SS type A sorting domain-containing protein [Candidatus Neomarinimicrobiota bacterium]